ncbi:hypothetical protein CHUAL_012469 [Chamberlinius hualienensis]
MDKVNEELKKRLEERNSKMAVETSLKSATEPQLKVDSELDNSLTSVDAILSKNLESLATTSSDEFQDSGVSIRRKVKAAFKRIKTKVNDSKRDDTETFHYYLGPEISTTDEDREIAQKQFSCLRSNANSSIEETKVFCFAVENLNEILESGEFTCFESSTIKLGECDWKFRIHLNTIKHAKNKIRKWTAMGLINVSQSPTAYEDIMFRKTIIVSGSPEMIKDSIKEFEFIDEPPFSAIYSQQWAGKQFSKPKFIRQTLLKNLNNNKLQVKCILEPLFPLVKMFNVDNGQLEWTIENGQWDLELPSLDHFKHHTTFTVINQGDNEKHFSKSDVNYDGYNCDLFYDFIPHSVLLDFNSPYIKNDCIKLRIEIRDKSQVKGLSK